jgi:nicotinate-nucleotide pyrophosphorylase
MLDNFEPGPLDETAAQVKQAFPSVLIEASGVSRLERA